LTWEEQFELDAVYVEKLSFFIDITVFLKTIYVVLVSKNMMVTGRNDIECFDDLRKQ
jgi:lipopolysaccharide/colanic/teichoic acid biosynthesis glycosyltransferase